MKQKLIVRSLAAAGIVTALGLGGVAHFESTTAHARTIEAAQPASGPALQVLPDFAKLVEQNGPAVVNISVTQSVKTSAAMPEFGIDPNDPMYEFFKRFQGQAPRGMQPQPQQRAPAHGLAFGRR